MVMALWEFGLFNEEEVEDTEQWILFLPHAHTLIVLTVPKVKHLFKCVHGIRAFCRVLEIRIWVCIYVLFCCQVFFCFFFFYCVELFPICV